MSGAGAVASWLPVLLVVLLSVLALIAAAAPAAAAATKRRRVLVIVLLGALAIAATTWQARSAADRIAHLIRDNRSVQLAAQIQSLQDRIAKLQENARGRTLSADTAAKLADYLRQSGAHSVVISCAPGDIEAYRYATQIADVLKAAGWDARGPETTTIFGAIRAMAINVYDAGGRSADTTKILLDGFAKFGIPYQSRVPPSGALPDSEAVELFIGTKPAPPAEAEVGSAPK
ncbi:MAG TPA: hypothetical protein VGM07_17405 [Stellaceae bacterium]|jgi:hypothetical protein